MPFLKSPHFGARGLHFQPVPPKVQPVASREVHRCSQFRKRAGSELLAFGVWPLGPQPVDSGVSGHNEEVPFGARGTAANPARPMAPAVLRATWASLPAIPIAGYPWLLGPVLECRPAPRAKALLDHLYEANS